MALLNNKKANLSVIINKNLSLKLRFYKVYAQKNVAKPHILTFRVWCESISLRYLIEIIVYIGLLVAFQYYLSNYN